MLFEKLLDLITTYIVHSKAHFALMRHFCYIGDIEQRAWVTDSANRRRRANVTLTLTHRLCRWSNIRATLGQRVVYAGVFSASREDPPSDK